MEKRTATALDRADLLEARLLDEREARIRAQIDVLLARHAPQLIEALDGNHRDQAAWRSRIIEEYGLADPATALDPVTGAIRRSEPEPRHLAVVPDPAAS